MTSIIVAAGVQNMTVPNAVFGVISSARILYTSCIFIIEIKFIKIYNLKNPRQTSPVVEWNKIKFVSEKIEKHVKTIQKTIFLCLENGS